MSRLLKEERDSWGVAIDIIGPAPSFFSRVRGRYRWQIILRGDDPHGLLDRVALPRGWLVDIDPVSVL
jgi:primosomal protein N' (replication factor Y)